MGERLSTWGGGIGAVAVKPTRAVAGVRVERVWATTFHKSRAWLLGLNLLTTTAAYVWAAAWRLRRGDVVVLVTSPRLLPRPVARVARWRGARVIVLVHDVYPDVFAAVGWLKRESWLYRRWNAWFIGGCRLAERVVVLGRDMEELVRSRMGARGARSLEFGVQGSALKDETGAWPGRVAVIPNWGEVDELRVVAKEASPVTDELGLRGKFVIGVGGTLGRTHDARFVVELAAALAGEPRVVLLVYASGVGRGELDEEVRRRKLEQVRLASPVAAGALNDWLAAADVMLVPFRAGMRGISVPSRMYNVFAAGRPLLVAGDAGSEAVRVVEEEAVGWAVAPGDVPKAAGIVRSLLAAPHLAVERGAKARALVERRYAFRHHVEAWARVLGALGAGGSEF